jgi:serine/threonine protein kinase
MYINLFIIDIFVVLYFVFSGKIIGRGAFSTVHIGRYFGDLVAVKKQTRDQKDLDEYLRRELAVLKNINHTNLVAYIGAWDEDNRKTITRQNVLFIVTEFCQGGDLLQLLLSDTPVNINSLICKTVIY